MKFSQFGSENGRLIIYFHGAPGAPEECAVFDCYGKENGLTLVCFDRFSLNSSIDGEAYYQFLAKEIIKKSAGEKWMLLGFQLALSLPYRHVAI